MKTALTIAGSDSGGGAGIQADLKAFSANGVFGMSVITAVTAQNTQEVRSVQNIDNRIIREQIEAVFDDIPVDAVKIGMLSSPATVETVAQALKKYQPNQIVLDPVMVSKGGHHLLQDEAIQSLIEHMIPLSTMITPNIPEAEVLVKRKIDTEEDMLTASKALLELGAKMILLKGGHLQGNPNDLFYDGQYFHWLHGERIETKNTHGTGCTLSSAIAANLAKGHSMFEAVKLAKQYISIAIKHSLDLGHGHGPTHHFYELYEKANLK
ncbi:hydroxymethylpyrimidine/phosphomethylpyrimidine kinase [Robertmurraya siralis]|uniref:Hydroxymethylpyrimidine/phosphomethylpyrimidine kinase n=1 Tax=Robertmurraya siralis TaxID=77777 RepID=A0A919WHL6_9BACI|nr:bifunctional hydroxymethylpyrimidine kinase/phosphomethylpyrimidine kinase [Robertmurraya siralis]PAE19080.1 bifunctional hydroxymethylpyrimidine kinase/phosphomethylpyrimidine kinase [Bacillus sp. 7504-2]GIN61861.1 hydroxymethylpyrimidine/phosphomethylpyrimidine kinase [Robertmurraya siralis]